MSGQSLEAMLNGAGDLVELLRNQGTPGPNVYPGVPAEYSNWRSEQWAWQNTAVLYNQSYHMVDLEVRGPDAFAMLEYLAVNSFKGFVPDKAKQFVPCTPYGHVIGDVILFLSGGTALQPGWPRALDRMGGIPRRQRQVERGG